MLSRINDFYRIAYPPHDGAPPITRTTFPTCRAHYPGGSSGCACRLLPHSCSLPQMAGGSASALSLSRPAQASLTLRPAELLNRLKRPLSRGSSPAGYPAEPLVSYQINRQLSGWNLPPLVIRAFGAYRQNRTFLKRGFCPFRTCTLWHTLAASKALPLKNECGGRNASYWVFLTLTQGRLSAAAPSRILRSPRRSLAVDIPRMAPRRVRHPRLQSVAYEETSPKPSGP
jgi:hypothetical protein